MSSFSISQTFYSRAVCSAALAVAMLAVPEAGLSQSTAGGSAGDRPTTVFAADGSTRVDNLTVPFSEFASPEAKIAWLKAHNPDPANRPTSSDIATLRAFYGKFNNSLAARMKELYAVVIKNKVIGGVRTEVITPAEGTSTANRHRVLINLHGGGFMWGEGSGGEVESIPIASVGKITVITVAYRMAPENQFPAGSEDVASVYRELLKTYKPSEIGIYGCSAGGALTAQSIAWMLTHGMTTPGAIGTFCASAAPISGDSNYILGALNADYPPPGKPRGGPYLAKADLTSPLVAPVNSPELLAKFPPTLLIAGSRDFAISSLFYTQRKLTVAGVEAELHVWDGLPHAFFMDPDLPESKEVYDVVVKFFDRHLAR